MHHLLARTLALPIGWAQAPNGLDGWADTLADIATIVIALALIVLAIALLIAAWASRRLFERLGSLLDRLHEDARPILRHGQDVAENVNYMSAAVRADVESLRVTLASAQATLARAAETTERRISDFNALVEVVQEEAERIFVDTASTVRGVRAGARTLRGVPGPEDEVELVTTPTRGVARGLEP